MKEAFIIFIVLLVLLMIISVFGGSIRFTPSTYGGSSTPHPPPPGAYNSGFARFEQYTNDFDVTGLPKEDSKAKNRDEAMPQPDPETSAESAESSESSGGESSPAVEAFTGGSFASF
jgi:hypothetical protein